MSYNDLFSTPNQGKRFAELVPSLTSAFMWASYNGRDHFITDQRAITNGAFIEYGCTFTPALTLQELRDVMIKSPINIKWSFVDLQFKIRGATAPELASWVIEAMEAQP